MRDFGVKLDAEEAARRVGEGGDRRIAAVREHLPPLREACHLVAVAHPDFCRVIAREAVKQIGVVIDGQFGGTVFPAIGARRLASKCHIDQTHAVADAKERHRQLKQPPLDSRRVFLVDARRAAGENNPFEMQRANFFERDVERMDLAVNLGLPDAPRDQLSILGSEIENEDHSAL